MRHPPSVLLQTGVLSLVAVVVAVAICFGIVLGLPLPAPAETTIGEMAAVMGHRDRGFGQGFRIAQREALPKGPQSSLVARGLAEALGIPAESVRVVWQRDAPVSLNRSSTGQALLTITNQDVVIDARSNGFNLRSGEGARLALDTRLPTFYAAVRQADGKWLVVTPPDAALAAWRWRVFIAFLISALVVAPLTWWLARKLTQPMRQLAGAANRAQLDRPSHLPISTGPREVREVAAAMDAMLARIHRQAYERTRMLAAVAHDLRNPLTSLRIRAESAAPVERDRMVADIDRMAGMITQVLDYARGHHAPVRGESLDLGSLLDACVEDSIVRGGDVSWSAPEHEIRVVADPAGLRRAIENLIENAIRYGTTAQISLETRSTEAVIRICDDGPGIPEADVERVMEPFERGEPSRSQRTGGIGLGLTIARDIVLQHRGTLRLANGAARGLEVEVALPLA